MPAAMCPPWFAGQTSLPGWGSAAGASSETHQAGTTLQMWPLVGAKRGPGHEVSLLPFFLPELQKVKGEG